MTRPDQARTACLMQGMAEHLSVDLARALSAGRLDRAERNAMVTRCRACTRGDDCIVWMVEHAQPDAAPEYCLNGERLGSLR